MALARIISSGLAGGLLSAAVASACSRIENRHSARAMNAIAHIYDGGEPPARDGERNRNTIVGFAIHMAASLWWASFFEPARRKSKGHPVAAAAAISAAAYAVDYYVVPGRFRPGFERHLSGASMLAIYAALAAGFALTARPAWRPSGKKSL
jgi:hypothetical protein